VYKITTSVIEDFALENVKYLELRTTPKSFGNRMTRRSSLQSVITAIKDCEQKNLGIKTRLLLSISREEALDAAIETMCLAEEFSNSGLIVGIDFSGNPHKGSFQELLPALQRAKQQNFKTTLHFAEVLNMEESIAMLNFQPNRLSHANFMDSNVWNLLLTSRIPLEVCLTSNMMTKSVKSFTDHHFRSLYQLQHPIVLCTDDSAIFSTSLSNEYFIAASTFGLNESELQNMTLQSIHHTFLTSNEKDELDSLFRTSIQKDCNT